MRQAGVFSVLGVSFVASCLILVLPLVNPVWAQATNDDPLAGLAVDIVEDPADQDEDVNSVGPIAASGCTVAADATVTVEDEDGTQVALTNGVNVVISANADQVTIVGSDPNGNLDVRPSGGDGQFGSADQTVEGTVVESTGFTCEDDTGTNTQRGDDAGGEEADDQQYGDERSEVILKTVPDKPLPKTGGFPLLVGAGLMVLAATVLGSRVIGRR
jgi:hypothetical protein